MNAHLLKAKWSFSELIMGLHDFMFSCGFNSAQSTKMTSHFINTRSESVSIYYQVKKVPYVRLLSLLYIISASSCRTNTYSEKGSGPKCHTYFPGLPLSVLGLLPVTHRDLVNLLPTANSAFESSFFVCFFFC